MGVGRVLKNFVLAYLIRPFKNYNVESRAHRLIGKEKKRAAPRHPGTEVSMTGCPTIQEEILKKDDGLLSRLKEVYVDSTDPLSEEKTKIRSSESEFRPAKQVKKHEMFMQHVFYVDRVPKGKLSVLETLTLLNNHRQAPKEWTAAKIAEEYNLNVQDSQALLEYFKIFTFQIISTKQIADGEIDSPSA